MFYTIILAFSVTLARPDTVSICNYYTEALFNNNTADNQYLLLSALVNRVVIGNFSETTTNINVPGILANGTFDNQKVSLLPFFIGTAGKTTNVDGVATSGINFLDGGGALPLTKGMPANDKSSNQFFLLTHLYQLFGTLLGCSEQGMPGFSLYQGDVSMYETHKFMNLGSAQNGYFITQVALAAKSFGVTDQDVKLVGIALTNLFEYKCSLPVSLQKQLPQSPQSICTADDCPLAKNPVCPIVLLTSDCIKNTVISLSLIMIIFISL